MGLAEQYEMAWRVMGSLEERGVEVDEPIARIVQAIAAEADRIGVEAFGDLPEPPGDWH